MTARPLPEVHNNAAHVRWLIAAPFSATPAGSLRTLDAGDFAAELRAAELSAEIDIGPALGADRPVMAAATFSKITAFGITSVISGAPVLAKIQALADRLGGRRSQRPTPAEALAIVDELAGEGPLYTALAELFGADEVQPKDELVDELIDRQRSPQARAVDNFVATGRSDSSTRSQVSASRKARDLLETAVSAGARAVLQDPAVRRQESLWRGLKLVLAQRSREAGIALDLLDVNAEDLADALEQIEDVAPMERPDAIFVAVPVASVTALGRLAQISAALHTPVIVEVSPSLWGVDVLADVPAVAAANDGWSALRGDESSRWLTVCANPIILAAEGTGDAARRALGSPALALASSLTASYSASRGFSRLVGGEGIAAPASIEVVHGGSRISIVTGEFVSKRAQAAFAGVGVLALACRRDGDVAIVTGAPTVRDAADAVALPAQILTGRVVRFALWARDQLPSGSTAAEVVELFTQAAGVFLLRGVSDDGFRVEAAVVEGDAGHVIRVGVAIHPALAGTLLQLEFDLPLTITLAAGEKS